jgi:MFS family permease
MWMWRITSPVILYELTGSTVMLGLLSVASYGPILVVSFVGGMLADRFSRRWLIAIAHGVIVTLLFGLAATSAVGLLTAQVIFAAAVVESVAFALAKPALQALVTELVAPEQIPRAVAVNTVHFSIAQLIGPGLATLSLFLGGRALGLIIAGCLYIPITFALFHVRSHHSVGSTRTADSGLNLIRNGFRALRIPMIAPLLVAIAFGSVALEGSVRVLAPSYATNILGMAEGTAGLIISCQALGAVAAVFVVRRVERSGNSLTSAQAGYAVMAIAIVAYSQAPGLVVALVLAALIGASQAVGFSIATGMIHRATPLALRGRVMAFHAMALLGVRPLAGVVAGFLASRFDTRIGSLCFFVSALLAAVTFRRFVSSPRARPVGGTSLDSGVDVTSSG